MIWKWMKKAKQEAFHRIAKIKVGRNILEISMEMLVIFRRVVLKCKPEILLSKEKNDELEILNFGCWEMVDNITGVLLNMEVIVWIVEQFIKTSSVYLKNAIIVPLYKGTGIESECKRLVC